MPGAPWTLSRSAVSVTHSGDFMATSGRGFARDRPISYKGEVRARSEKDRKTSGAVQGPRDVRTELKADLTRRP